MKKLYAVIALIWLALLPPLFTHGACTAEFDRAYTQVISNQNFFSTPEIALLRLRSEQWQASLLTPDACRHGRPRWVERCGYGPLVIAKRPVVNRICSLYRDDSIRAQLEFDEGNHLGRILIEMEPFKTLPLPFGWTLHWAR
jgi:hypothetical protein